jgi:putative peptidoglycan lipid II flippase
LTQKPVERLPEASAEPASSDPFPDTQAETNAGVARATGVISLGNIASRVLGMARDVTLTNVFGASRATDAFYIAIIVPKTIYDLLIAGHVNSAIVPVLSEIASRDGKKALWGILSILISLIVVVLAGVVLLLQAFAPAVIVLVGGGADPVKQALATELLRLTAPALIFLGLFAVLSGALYALQSFTLPAFAGAVFNGSIVVGTILLAPPVQVTPVLDGVHVTWTLARPEWGIQAAALGWLLGALVQMAFQLPGLRGARLRLTLHWRHPAVKRIMLLYVPVMFSLILDTLVRTFSYNLASQTGERSITYMNLATTLIQFPQGLVATAISIAILPTLSRQSDDAPFKDTLGLGLRLAITLILPATVGLLVLATPIVGLLFEHGAFQPHDTVVTALALRLYLLGLPFAAVDLLLVYAFYARQDTLIPALIGLLSLVVYTVVAVVLLPQYGIFSLMLADSVKHLTHALVSAYLLARKMGGFSDQRFAQTLIKTALASALMGGAAFAAFPLLERLIGSMSLLREIVLVGAVGGLSVVVFVGAAALLRIEEFRWIAGLVWARVRR